MAFAVGLALAAGIVAVPPPSARAGVAPCSVEEPGTTLTVESYLLTWLNRDRAARGLRPLRLDSAVRALARERAANLAGASSFSHAAAGGDIGAALAEARIQHWSAGENIAWTLSPPGAYAASSIYSRLRRSSAHWALMMSRTFNYVGIGAAERASDGRTFVSIVFTESRDHTPPTARMSSATRSGTTVTFRWTGADRPLQTHTAGLRDFDVEYRIDGGTWRLVRDNTTATGTSWTNRPRGHTYWVRVRSRDRAGNLSAWSTPKGITVP
jgi:uncharacterized protein YkwD